MHTPVRGNRFMLFLMIYQLLLVVLFSAYYVYADGPDWLNGIPMLVLNQFLTFMVPLIVYIQLSGQSIDSVLPLKRLDAVNAVLIVLMCVTVQPIMALLSALSSLIYPNNVSNMLDRIHEYPFIYILAAVSLTPAICEELCFRGIILTNYKNVDIKKAAIINGFFFGVIHMDMQQFLYAFVLGALFALFVHYTKSILASVLAHFTINSIQVGLNYAASSTLDLPQEVMSRADMLSAIVSLLILTAIFLPVFLILLKSFISLNRRKNLLTDMFILFTDLSGEPRPSDQGHVSVLTPSFWAVVGIFAVYMIGSVIQAFLLVQ